MPANLSFDIDKVIGKKIAITFRNELRAEQRKALTQLRKKYLGD